MSPNTVFPLDERPQNPVTQRVLQHPRVTFDVDGDALVVAIRDELLVRASARTGRLEAALRKVASLRGSLGGGRDGGPGAGGLADDVEVWRLDNPRGNSIDTARRLRELAPVQRKETTRGTRPQPRRR